MIPHAQQQTQATQHDRTSSEDSAPFELTREHAAAIARRIAKMASPRTHSVVLEYRAKSITRVANGRVMINDDGVIQNYVVSLRIGNQWGSADFSSLDDASLRAAVAYAEEMARLKPSARKSQYRMPRVRLPVPEVGIWKAPTLDAMIGDRAETVRSTALPSLQDVINRTPFVAAGVLGFLARAQYLKMADGMESYYRETDVLCSVSARAKDGSSSGWAGAASRDWTTTDVTDVARRALTMAEQSVKPVALEPGRRTVILSATACGQLIAQLAGMLGAAPTDSGVTPFSRDGGGSKLGQRVADERVRLWSDPADPMGGYMPFWGDFQDHAFQMDVLPGAPVPAMTWIDRGMLTNLAYGYRYSLNEGKPWNRLPFSIHLDAVAGTARATVDEMIADCKEGIFVNRFSSLMPVDGRSGLFTGVTRDGCLLIKNGKILKAVKNFRFLDSPIFVLNKLVAMGTPERVVTDDSLPEGAVFPIIAPPVMVRDFNFSALSDAV